ncbi:MAG TPA: ABC transporter permease subunit [Egibacteraceae bacterium]|nr:ABC transporter permease subunit [Egibacteraceae bacterium]
MTTAQEPAAPRQRGRPPPWRDVRVLRAAFQVAFVVLVGALLWYLLGNLRTNLRVSGLPTGFDYLDRPAGVDIRDSPFRPSQPIRDAIVVGLVNTVRGSVVGIALATVLGILVGVARLSTNWLVRKGAAVYVETLRNVPVLVTIIFMYTAVVLRLPPISRASEWLGLIVFSNRGLVVPWGVAGTGARAFTGVVGGAFALAVIVGLWRSRRFDETGEPHHRVLWGGAVLVIVTAAGYVAFSRPVTLTLPTREGRIVQGGIQLGPEYAALLIGLVLYTASHIAEIVRGSILAVPKGQTEAANALALSGFQRLRFVVLPQALRIMLPPLANQYLNLTKNSSLAVAVGYFELTRITGQIIANANPAPQSIAILMLLYLALSLLISLVANIVNRSLALETR